MEERLSLNITVREEQMEDKKVFIVSNEELGVADFGDTLDEALENFKKSVRDYLEAYPKRRETIQKEESPVLVSKIMI